jgi:APA family basic amino acid/polyamine antiporter
MTVTTVIYVAVAISATAVVGADVLASSPAPLAAVARHVLGSRADGAMTVIALAATANTVLLLYVAAARSVYGMSAAGVLPARFAHVGPRGIPTAATVLVLVVTALLVLIGDVRHVATLTDAAVLVSFVLVNASLVWLAAGGRARSTGVRRALDVVVAAVATTLCGWLALHTGWLGAATVVVVLLSGVAVSAGMRKGGVHDTDSAVA